MKILHYSKPLTSAETFPCTVKLLKNLFRNELISVGIGIKKKYEFDSKAKNKPVINGKVIASVTVNNRETYNEPDCQLNIFPIERQLYSEKDMNIFDSKYIYILFKWYKENVSNVISRNVRCMIIVFYNHSFEIKCFMYQ